MFSLWNTSAGAKMLLSIMSLLRGKKPVFLKADIRFSWVADFMYAAQASWHCQLLSGHRIITL
jgi:hypothetical protein